MDVAVRVFLEVYCLYVWYFSVTFSMSFCITFQKKKSLLMREYILFCLAMVIV